MNNTNTNPMNSMSPLAAQRRAYEAKYSGARVNLLFVVALTALNIILLVTGGSSYFLFSASIPYFIADIGMLLCGKYPPDMYVGELEGMAIFEPSVVAVFIIIALALVSIYLICWFFSKKKSGWLISALILFVVDTVGMLALYGIALDFILDIVLHGYVIWSLVSGIRAHNALMKLPEDEPVCEAGDGYITVDPIAPTADEAAEEAAVTESVPTTEETPKEENSDNT